MQAASAVASSLPDVLDEPMLFLSERQSTVVARKFPSLRGVALPSWVPQRLIAQDLGFSPLGMEAALAAVGRPYCWATELENVHSLWNYAEPQLKIDGDTYACSEQYYHSQKPQPFDAGEWDRRKDAVMMKALRAKLLADPSIAALLLATKDHPLLSIKPDQYWGFDAETGGRNRLAQLWMELRTELQEAAAEKIPSSGPSPTRAKNLIPGSEKVTAVAVGVADTGSGLSPEALQFAEEGEVISETGTVRHGGRSDNYGSQCKDTKANIKVARMGYGTGPNATILVGTNTL